MPPRHRDVRPALRAPRAVRRLPLAVRRFLETETSGGVLLVVAAFTALAWANSPWTEGYEQFRQTEVALRVGSIGIQEDLQHFVNDALMALFFLVVGLELKREMVTGDLRDRHVVALSVFAALGGMVVPAAIYAAVNAGGPGSGGWGIPMATDTAFTLGVLALLGKRVPLRRERRGCSTRSVRTREVCRAAARGPRGADRARHPTPTARPRARRQQRARCRRR